MKCACICKTVRLAVSFYCLGILGIFLGLHLPIRSSTTIDRTLAIRPAAKAREIYKLFGEKTIILAMPEGGPK